MFNQYPQLLNYPTKCINIGFGESANYTTINEMIHVIKESSNNPYIRRWAEHIIQNIPARDQLNEAKAIYYFCRDNIRYTPDPLELEYLQTPPLLLSKIEQNVIPMGDCDDACTLSSSLLRSIGIPCKIRITSYSPNKDWTHVYTMALIGNINDGTYFNGLSSYIAIDPIRNNEPFGWEAPNPTRVKDFIIN